MRREGEGETAILESFLSFSLISTTTILMKVLLCYLPGLTRSAEYLFAK